MTVRDVVIIGSGPAGLTAGIYASRAGLNALLLAGSMEPGGALVNTTEVENFPGFATGIMGPELMDQMIEQANNCGTEIEYETVEKLDLTEPVKTVHLEDGSQVLTKTVILAMGSAYRKLGVPGEKELTGKGVSSCATCDGPFFKEKNVIVVGGGDSAIEEATYLAKIVNHVTLVVRGESFRASQAMVNKLSQYDNVTVLWRTQVVEIHGDTKVSSVTLSTVDGLIEMGIDGVFVAIGHDPRNELVKETVKLHNDGHVYVVHPSTATNVEGVFACGDLVDRTYKQAITAAGSGCQAAIDANHYLTDLTS